MAGLVIPDQKSAMATNDRKRPPNGSGIALKVSLLPVTRSALVDGRPAGLVCESACLRVPKNRVQRDQMPSDSEGERVLLEVILL